MRYYTRYEIQDNHYEEDKIALMIFSFLLKDSYVNSVKKEVAVGVLSRTVPHKVIKLVREGGYVWMGVEGVITHQTAKPWFHRLAVIFDEGNVRFTMKIRVGSMENSFSSDDENPSDDSYPDW